MAAEPPPETTQGSLLHAPSICIAPQYLAEEFLRLEGFTDSEYLPLGARTGSDALADGRADITMWDTPGLMPLLDAGKPIVAARPACTAGCYELFGNERVRAIRDLKGKTVGRQYFGGGDHVLLSSMLAYVGHRPRAGRQLDRRRRRARCDGRVRRRQGRRVPRVRAASPQNCARKKVGHVIVNTAHGSALVAVFLLHGRRESGLRAAPSGRDQARAARDPQGDRHLRRDPAAGGAVSVRQAVTNRATTIGLKS